MTVKIVIDLKKLLRLISPEEYFGIFGMAGASVGNDELYVMLLDFVVDENGNYMTPDEARKHIKANVKMDEFGALVAEFRSAIVAALVNPTKGGK